MEKVHQLMKDAVAQGVFPGGVLLVSEAGHILTHEGFGYTDNTNRVPVSTRTLYDLASLTKPLATTLALMKLIAIARLSLDDTMDRFMAACKGMQTARISIRQLLHHTAGLAEYRPYFKALTPEQAMGKRTWILEKALEEPLLYSPGETVLYSDLGFILLRGIIETVVGQRLDKWVHQEIYQPLHLQNLFYVDVKSKLEENRVAATEQCAWRKTMVRGVVHDENAYVAEGVDGQAGLFGASGDVHHLLVEILRTYTGRSSGSVFQRDIVTEFLNFAIGSGPALGFDRPSAENSASGHLFSKNTVGHLGFTGTSFWVDLERSIIVILLTNRVHPSRKNEKIRAFRPRLHDAIMETLS